MNKPTAKHEITSIEEYMELLEDTTTEIQRKALTQALQVGYKLGWKAYERKFKLLNPNTNLNQL